MRRAAAHYKDERFKTEQSKIPKLDPEIVNIF